MWKSIFWRRILQCSAFRRGELWLSHFRRGVLWFFTFRSGSRAGVWFGVFCLYLWWCLVCGKFGASSTENLLEVSMLQPQSMYFLYKLINLTFRIVDGRYSNLSPSWASVLAWFPQNGSWKPVELNPFSLEEIKKCLLLKNLYTGVSENHFGFPKVELEIFPPIILWR